MWERGILVADSMVGGNGICGVLDVEHLWSQWSHVHWCLSKHREAILQAGSCWYRAEYVFGISIDSILVLIFYFKRKKIVRFF